MKYKKGVNILALNCGSSSLKYKIIEMPQERELSRGEAQRVGIKTQALSAITHFCLDKKTVIEAPIPDHVAALKKVLELVEADAKVNGDMGFGIFAHRYVHPGNNFSRTTKVSAPVLGRLRETLPLAAIHNPVSYRLMGFCHKEYPRLTQYAVFDTVFHKTIPPAFATYAIPRSITKKYGIRKIGFHGISHRYVMEEACRFLGRDKFQQKIISCHLGTGGSSICAIDCGRSVNNSMGFTPLEGLMMNTRCGDIDPGAVFYIMFKEKFSSGDAEDILNKKSGILGVFDSSSDLREVIRGMGNDKRARMAFDMYVRRVKTYIAFYTIILKKADVLVFTDSLGAGEPLLRESISGGMDFAGIKLNRELNAAYSGGIKDISVKDSEARILIIPANEELMIAREAYREFSKDDHSR
ncbi:MAG: acetate/propionate family kinase [Candidatus Omnitrophota bacterium]